MRSRSGTSSPRRLTLARDPIGIKPLFVTEQKGGLAFASEIHGAARASGSSLRYRRRRRRRFLLLRPRLAAAHDFQAGRPLEPGHVLHVGPVGEAVIRPFLAGAAQGRTRHLRSATGSSRPARESCGPSKQHMLSDVPVGAFLSGGVDSGAVAAAMARTSSGPFKVFTAGFPGSQSDETEAARPVAEHLGLRACRAADAAADCGRSAPGGAARVRRADRRESAHSALVSVARRAPSM